MKRNKKFDCVKMKNDIQERLYERRKNMTEKEELEDIEKGLSNLQSPAAQWWSNVTQKEASSNLSKMVIQ